MKKSKIRIVINANPNDPKDRKQDMPIYTYISRRLFNFFSAADVTQEVSDVWNTIRNVPLTNPEKKRKHCFLVEFQYESPDGELIVLDRNGNRIPESELDKIHKKNMRKDIIAIFICIGILLIMRFLL